MAIENIGEKFIDSVAEYGFPLFLSIRVDISGYVMSTAVICNDTVKEFDVGISDGDEVAMISAVRAFVKKVQTSLEPFTPERHAASVGMRLGDLDVE